MALASLQEDFRNRRIQVPPYQAPAEASAPQPTAAPAVPDSSPAKVDGAQQFYANLWGGLQGSTPQTQGKQTDQGWVYDWRPEPYQNQLSPGEISDQQAEYAYRQAHAGQRLAADGTSI